MSKSIKFKYDNEEYYPIGLEKKFILYNNSNGSNSTITLSDNIDNYICLEIFFGWEGGSYGLTSTKLHLATSKIANITCHALNNSQLYIASSQWTANGTSITATKSEYWVLKTTSYPVRNTSSKVYIFKVIGYK